MITAGERERQLRALFGRVSLLGSASGGARTFGRHEISASIVPSAPALPMANVVVYSSPKTIALHLREVLDAYDQDGVTACRIWQPCWGGGEEAGAFRRAGFTKQETLLGMASDLTQFTPRAASPELTIDVTEDPSTLASVNRAAFGARAAGIEDALTHAPPGRHLRFYRANQGAETVSVLCAIDRADVCALSFLATAPQARGRGFATALVNAAMGDAQERGCEYASVQAPTTALNLFALLGWEPNAFFFGWDRNL